MNYSRLDVILSPVHLSECYVGNEAKYVRSAYKTLQEAETSRGMYEALMYVMYVCIYQRAE